MSHSTEQSVYMIWTWFNLNVPMANLWFPYEAAPMEFVVTLLFIFENREGFYGWLWRRLTVMRKMGYLSPQSCPLLWVVSLCAKLEKYDGHLMSLFLVYFYLMQTRSHSLLIQWKEDFLFPFTVTKNLGSSYLFSHCFAVTHTWPLCVWRDTHNDSDRISIIVGVYSSSPAQWKQWGMTMGQ